MACNRHEGVLHERDLLVHTPAYLCMRFYDLINRS